MHGYFYYPSKYGPVHPGLGGRDLLGEQVAACKAAGIKVYVYYGVTWDNFLAEQHPEWLCYTRERDTYLPKFDETPGWTALCLSNEDFVELMLDHTKEILDRVAPDGIWYDMPMPNRQNECFCRNCLAALRGAGKDPLDLDVQRERMQELELMWLRRSKEFVAAVSPGVEVQQNNQTRLGLAQRVEFLESVDIEALPGGDWGWWYFPINARYVRGLGRPGIAHTARFMGEWGDFGGLKSSTELTLEAAWMASTGAAVSVGDQAPPHGALDKGVYRQIGAAYRALVEVDDVLAGAVGVAEAALYVSSTQLTDLARVERHASNALRDGLIGLTQLLVENRVQFDVVEASTVDLSRYRLLVIAEGSVLTPDAVQEVQRFVAGGGLLIHSSVPGTTLDEAPWLREIGVRAVERSPFAPAYVRIDDGFGDSYDGFEFALYDGADRWTVSDGALVGGRLGEPLFQRSPQAYTSHAQTPVDKVTGWPAIVIGRNVAAFSFPIGAGYCRHGYWIYAELFRRALDSIYPDRCLRTDAPRSLELELTYQQAEHDHRQRWMVHALNFAGANRKGDPRGVDYYDEVVPQRGVGIAVAVPAMNVRAYDARTRMELETRRESGRFVVTLPEIAIHEVVVFEESPSASAGRVAEGRPGTNLLA